MRVVGVVASTKSAMIVLVEGGTASFTVPFRDEWKLTADDRLEDYVELRTRLQTHLGQWKPHAVCVEQLDAGALKPGSRARPTLAWFETAELRGVLAEAARATGIETEIRSKPATRAAVGERSLSEYVADDAFWKHLGTGFLKKYRPAVLLALSRIRQA